MGRLFSQPEVLRRFLVTRIGRKPVAQKPPFEYPRSMPPPSTSSPELAPGQRQGKTARAMFEAKMKRVNAMTPLERMTLALRLGYRLRLLTLAANSACGDD